MACMNPNVIVRTKVGNEWTQWKFVGPYKFWKIENHRLHPSEEIAFIGCGKCPACKKEWRNQLSQRFIAEYNNYGVQNSCFLTLTVNDDNLDHVFPNHSLDHSYFQKFMKKLRNHLERRFGFKAKIKYFMCGEYGANTGRPHFHVVLFGWRPTDLIPWSRSKKGIPQFRSEFIENLWDVGFVTVGNVTEGSAGYLAKYLVKYSEISKDDFCVVNNDTGEIYEGVRKPYLVYPHDCMGFEYFMKNCTSILEQGCLQMKKGICGIPKSWLKKIKVMYEGGELSEKIRVYYELYLKGIEVAGFDKLNDLVNQGFDTYGKMLQKLKEDGARQRERYENFVSMKKIGGLI
nr:MAG: replication initiation protein [Microvirus Sku118]